MVLDYSGMNNFILERLNQGIKGVKIYEDVKSLFGYKAQLDSFYVYLSRLKRKQVKKELPLVRQESLKKKPESSDLLNILKEKGHVKLIDLCDIFSCSPKKIHEFVSIERRKGNEVLVEDDYVFCSGNIS
jgi:hypothetical protein